MIGNKINDKTYIPLPPFKGFVLENFPFIEADFDAITNYQLLCKVIEYLNNVIANQNTVQELGSELVTYYNALVDAVNLAINDFETGVTADINQFKLDVNTEVTTFETTMTTKFNNLKNYVDNYFDNNFPTLVSNKLDEMASNGTLQNLLFDYADIYKVYDTHADILLDENIVNGMKIKTLGYNTINDGGNAEYYITNSEHLTEWQESLGNDLYLELVPKKIMSSIVFGDVINTVNDSILLQSIFNYIENKKIQLYLIKDKTYNIGTPIKINSNLYVDFNNATFKLNDDINDCFLYNTDNYETQSTIIENITLLNGNVNGNGSNNSTGNLSGMFINLYNGNNINVDNFNISNCQRNVFNLFECGNLKFNNINFSSISKVNTTSIPESACFSINNRLSTSGITRYGSNAKIENITVDDYGYGVIFILGFNNVVINNVKCTNGIESPARSIPLTLTECEYIDMSNIYIDKTSSVAFEINQNTKYLNVDNMKITNSYQPLTFGPNTKPDSQNDCIKFTNCLFDKSNSGSYMMAINNTKNIIFENCYNSESSGIASSYTLLDNIVFKNCKFYFNFSDFYLQRYWKIENSIINDNIVHILELILGTSFPKLDIEMPYDLTSGNSIDVTIPFGFSTHYNFSGNLDVFGFFSSNSYYQYFAKYLYKTSVNGSDTGTIVDLSHSIGDNYYKVTPTATTRNKITLTKTASESMKGFIHLYN